MVAGPVAVAASVEEVPVAVGNQNSIPMWAKNFITDSDMGLISDAVKAAEKKTTGEIVPMIVHRSSVISHVPLISTMLILIVLLVLEVPQWDWFSAMNAYWLLLVVAIVVYGVCAFLTRMDWFQRIFTAKRDQQIQVEERALIEFYQQSVGKTAEKTGILIFISAMEKRAVILADEGIAQKLPEGTWDQICTDLVKGIKKGEKSQSLIAAIHQCGELLSQHFPARAENSDELSNQLILKE